MEINHTEAGEGAEEEEEDQGKHIYTMENKYTIIINYLVQ